jgi:hypothetical protein
MRSFPAYSITIFKTSSGLHGLPSLCVA